MGWLQAINISDAATAYYRIDQESIWEFIERPETWVAWQTERITDPDLRAWAEEVRAAGPRWLTPRVASGRLHVSLSVLAVYARRGLLHGVFYNHWYYREDEIAGLTLLSEREPIAQTCDACGREFKSERALAVHQRQAHRDRTCGGGPVVVVKP